MRMLTVSLKPMWRGVVELVVSAIVEIGLIG